MQIENEYILRDALSSGLNLVLGAGFSVLAQDLGGDPVPLGSKLQGELRSTFNLPSGLELPMMASILEAENRDAFHAFLRRRFSVSNFDLRYRALDSLEIRNILTTNIDDLVFHIYGDSVKHYINDKLRHGPVYRDRSAVEYVALHGCVRYKEDSFIFSNTSIASAFSNDPDKWARLTNGIQDYPTVFWGHRLSDAGVLQGLSPLATKGRARKEMWILTQEDNPASNRYLKALGFNLIHADTIQFLDYLASLPVSTNRASPTDKLRTNQLFPDDCIPDLGRTPARPIVDFYLGASPDWYDIFSGRLHRTNHASRIENQILSGKNLIVMGMTASGKSTLMMQVAADIRTDKHKLVFDSLTPEKADLVLNKLSNNKALIFVDNFADSIDAFAVLAQSPNIQAVGFDRDYLFERASHLLERSKFEILNVTPLEPVDIQSIYEKIPPEIRAHELVIPNTEEGVNPSLHEVIESNITAQGLSSRFAHTLKQLESDNRHLSDFLVMCCYVHSCRVPVTYGLASAFLSDSATSYHDVLEHIERLRTVILDYTGPLVDVNEDHFIPRSTLFAEAIIDQVSAASLKRVLLKFHNEISPTHICRYDVFRRSAFDAQITKKAFPSWEEGRDFYESLFNRERSPYLRQQGALYLAAKRRFREAFAWIDEARNLTQGKVFSIRNSYAIILFRANIDAEDPWAEKVRQTLQQSMTMLAECYRYDLRKQYHAHTFADQAVKFCDIYADQEAKLYLQRAMVWLDAEHRKDEQNRSTIRLRESVARRLRDLDSIAPTRPGSD